MADRRHELAVGGLLLGAFALLAWLSVQVGAVGSFGPTTVVTLRLPDAAGLQVGADVKTAGVPIGRVTSLRLVDGQAEATLTLDGRPTLPADVEPQVRARSLLGEKFVALVAPPEGGEGTLQDGAVLVMTERPADLDDVIAALAPLARAVDPEALQGALTSLAEALREDPDRLARLLAHLDALLADGAAAAESLPALVDDVDRTVSRADRVLATAQVRLDALQGPIDRAGDLLTSLDGSGSEVRAAVEEARETLRSVRERIDAIEPAMLDDLAEVLDNLAEIDKWEARRLLREEGILIRLREHEVQPEEQGAP